MIARYSSVKGHAALIKSDIAQIRMMLINLVNSLIIVQLRQENILHFAIQQWQGFHEEK